jgi:hypothetical protein
LSGDTRCKATANTVLFETALFKTALSVGLPIMTEQETGKERVQLGEDRRRTPLQNRVMPTGEIVSHPGRGMLMGNRGCIHNPDRTIGVTRWRSKLWISCLLDFRGWKRDVMPPGRWTALFFLDEPTALAAGHRPCGYCRADDHRWFGESWQAARDLPARPTAAQMNSWLHAERVEGRTRRQLTREVALGDLPDGAMVRYEGSPALRVGDALLPWSFEGYGPALRPEPDTRADLLTPPAIIGALKAGYRPLVHPSAGTTSMRTIG